MRHQGFFSFFFFFNLIGVDAGMIAATEVELILV